MKSKKFISVIFFIAFFCLPWERGTFPSNAEAQNLGNCSGKLALNAARPFCFVGKDACVEPNKCIPCVKVGDPKEKAIWCLFEKVLGTGHCQRVIPKGFYYYDPDSDGNCRYCEDGKILCAIGKSYKDKNCDPKTFVANAQWFSPINACPVGSFK